MIGKSGKLFSSVLIISTIFTWIPVSPAIAQTSQEATVPKSTNWRLTIPVAPNTTLIVEKSGTEPETKHLLVSDYLSSTRTILAEDGTITNTPSYYPYGGDQVPSNKSQVTNRFYTGQRKVTNTDNIYNYNARYYNPDNGIFTQPDTIEGLNKYAYVGGNPIMKNDPSGMTMTTGGGEGGYGIPSVIQHRDPPARDIYKELIGVANHPIKATSCKSDYTSCAIGRIDAWTGGAYSFATMGNKGLSPLVKSSHQYVSQDEAEVAFMVSNAFYTVLGEYMAARSAQMGTNALGNTEGILTAKQNLANHIANEDIATQAIYRDFIVNGIYPFNSGLQL